MTHTHPNGHCTLHLARKKAKKLHSLDNDFHEADTRSNKLQIHKIGTLQLAQKRCFFIVGMTFLSLN